ncbi:hypothetical protein NE237_011788 [Protea cynaroides]|uniref:Major facilitator superfamily (MFS) profile domain-containing protein n=1 Tax=Protea cynaroides TaxID=273540 RepID=A0A9Q0GWU4_9MAGN|nr:hypothetical protein NE237_011788 [Protea cynaroides]
MTIEQDMEAGEDRMQEEIKEPLILSGRDGATKGTKESMSMVYFSTFVAVCGSFEFGSCIGFSSPTQSAIREGLDLSLPEYSLFGSILNFGAMIGAITSGTIADFIGRKGALRISAISCIAGWFAIYFAEGALSLDIGRLFKGYGMGVFSYVVPVFISEIAPKNLRGGLTTVNQLMICCGVSISFIIGTVLTWRTLALTGKETSMELFLNIPLDKGCKWPTWPGYKLRLVYVDPSPSSIATTMINLIVSGSGTYDVGANVGTSLHNVDYPVVGTGSLNINPFVVGKLAVDLSAIVIGP